MTVRVFWDNCDKCSADAVLDNLSGKSSCPACSGEGFRRFREMKDARNGLLYKFAEDACMGRLFKKVP
jgi:DnaJ-class molecular chaperone